MYRVSQGPSLLTFVVQSEGEAKLSEGLHTPLYASASPFVVINALQE